MCYIAPERFVPDTTSIDSAVLNESEPSSFANLTPEMDIFSTGCVLFELWSDGTLVPFDYSQLLDYKKGNKDLTSKNLQSIDYVDLRMAIKSMIDLEPKNRKHAEIYLSEMRGSFFPEYFYSFLQPFMQMFSYKCADDKISILRPDIEAIINIVNAGNSTTEGSIVKENGVILIISVVTSSIRGLVR